MKWTDLTLLRRSLATVTVLSTGLIGCGSTGRGVQHLAPQRLQRHRWFVWAGGQVVGGAMTFYFYAGFYS